MQNKQHREVTSQGVAALNVLRNELRASASILLLHEMLAACLLLRLADLEDAELGAMAVFEDRTYQPLLPELLQWRQCVRLDLPHDIAERLQKLVQYLENLRGDAARPFAGYLRALAEPLRRVLTADMIVVRNFMRLVDDLPFETPRERRVLLGFLDQAIVESGDAFEGQYSTPMGIAVLVAALANPQPGERVYDPCFGSGNFLVAAWAIASRSRNESRRPGALLDVAGVEINGNAFLTGLTRMLLGGIEAPRLELGNSLEREPPSSPGRQGFDVVLANPPIGAKTSREPWLSQHFAIATNDSTGLFIQHALSQLKPKGRAVIAVPEGFLFRGGADRELRRCLLEQGQVEAVIGLPAGSFAPYTSVKGSLLVLSKQGGTSRVRMVDAAPLFEQHPRRKPPLILEVIALQLADEVRRPELRMPRELPPGVPEGTPGTGVLARSVWEVGIDELAAADWDLSPRRREKGGLDELLTNLKEVLGDSGSVAPLSSVAKVSTGRSIKSADLLDEPPLERAVGYVRIKDLSQGKVGRSSSWLQPELAGLEQRWALLPGDVLISKSGTIGKAALVRNGAIGSIAANGLYVLRADQAQLDAGYLLAYLASPACQNWLSAQSRGAVIQHLNRAVLDRLLIPLPPLQMQAKAAAQFLEFGTDALAFLAQATGSSESDRLATWLAELDARVPKFVGGLDDTPSLGHFEPVVALARAARRWLDQDQVTGHSVRWLAPLTQTLLSMADVAQIPRGPGLLNVLQESERGAQATIEQTTGHLPVESQARAISERLRDWLRAAIADLVDANGLQIRTSPGSLVAGGFAEFSVELENPGALPLRNVRVQTRPDWGIGEIPYLAERSAFSIHLRGDVSKQGGDLSLHLLWRAGALSGQAIEGEIELVIRVAEPEQTASALPADLGSSPYITGSPLYPQYGHSVFLRP